MIRQHRLLFITLVALLLSSFAAFHGVSGAAGATATTKNITIGNIGWDEDVAVNNVLKVLLESKGYHVTLQLADAGPLYLGVSTGSIDVFMDTWLPNTQKIYWTRYKGKVVKLKPWYTGDANIGLAVPDYVKAQTIADLNKYSSQFGGQIVGIEAGAGEMNVVKTAVIPGYGLHYTLLTSSTPAMLSQVKRDLTAKKAIVFTAWKPHWMFTAYHIRYLKDPKGLMGKSEQLSAIVRTGLAKDAPGAYKLLSNFRINAAQLGSLELVIKGASDPEAAARAWLKKNPGAAHTWLAGVGSA